jgi:hypothetical protein
VISLFAKSVSFAKIPSCGAQKFHPGVINSREGGLYVRFRFFAMEPFGWAGFRFFHTRFAGTIRCGTQKFHPGVINNGAGRLSVRFRLFFAMDTFDGPVSGFSAPGLPVQFRAGIALSRPAL